MKINAQVPEPIGFQLAPMLDVVFLLLIFFVVTQKFILNEQDLKVKVPTALLNLKPCIEVKGGKMSVVKKYRGNFDKCLPMYVKDRLADRDDLTRDTLFVTCTPVDDAAYSAVMKAVDQYGNFDTVYETKAGCTVSCHCGPGTLGVLFVRK